eukprot:EC837504.1.p6 GENE.EC837504.1~~EC837504.1.p6  ORF type:complete len:54 (-),score=4.39 EC837504.1:207-368(-)
MKKRSMEHEVGHVAVEIAAQLPLAMVVVAKEPAVAKGKIGVEVEMMGARVEEV